MAKYQDEIDSTAELLEEAGSEIDLIRTVNGDFDTVTGIVETESVISGVGVLLNYTTNEINNTSILTSDHKLLYSGVEPKVSDRFGLEKIIKIKTLDPAGDGVILYTCQMRA